ncbi:hypothetical protein M446_4079 [Methylobacterium sp. 4-46]|uniref:hypothetical protein n=1 Tax=unclassified Methylobacterium TaxID=2615210 RepID=UPI000152E467|nr:MULTISPECIES: hypothetical protein [Methylobacterium]ACA18437.1 hypothetical protein M446_4079 [Methylobacterium sp. 4-46]WFT77729.1 hypothetical protein QA634_20735 [Methylobacterium nodulans]
MTREPARTYLVHFRDNTGLGWIEETLVDNGLTAAAAFLSDERSYAVLEEVYEIDLADPLAPVARNMTAPVLGRVVDMIDQDDERNELPAGLQEAARRHGVKACAENAPRDCGGLDFLAEGRDAYHLQVRGAL